MSDLDRFEEYARESREAGGAYAPEYEADGPDMAEKWGAYHTPDLVRVPTEPHIVDRLTGAPIGEILGYTTYCPTWEPKENWTRDVVVQRKTWDGRPEVRQIELSRLEIRAWRLEKA